MPMGYAHDTRKANRCRFSRFLTEAPAPTDLLYVEKLVFSAVCLALAFILSYLQPYKLPWGGSVTLFSMLFVCLIGNWYGLRTGLTVAFTYSILQFLQGGGTYILTPLQVCCDYFFAFTA